MARWLVFVLASCASASAAPRPLSPLTPERAVQFRRISDLRMSPDGARLGCVVSEAMDPEPVSHIWIANLRANELHQLTFAAKSDRQPRWSPDGRTLAFLSARGAGVQLYTIPIDGGESAPLTAVAGGVRDFAWSPDGTQLAVLAHVPVATTNDAIVADRVDDLDQIWLVDLHGSVRQLTHGGARIDELVWAQPDRLLVIASEHPAREAWDAAIYRVALTDGALTAVARPAPPFKGLVASPDGKRLATIGTATHGPIPHDLFVQDVDVSRAVDRAVIDARWQDNDTTIARVSDGFQTTLYRFGRMTTRIDLPLSVRAFDVARDGTLAYVGVGFDHLPELYVQHPGTPPQQLGHVQDAAWAGVALADANRFRFASFDGREIEAALLKPQSSGKLPLVVLVHGGPSSAFSADYFWFNAWAQILVAHGYAVLLVNPRGSTGYGEAFVAANRGDWGGGDYKDVMAALDHVMATNSIDPQRIGIGGWSYGGEMTAWAIGHTTRFRAAVVGAGVFDLAAELETEADPAGDEWYFGTPWEHPEVFSRQSPMVTIKNAKTPTLIFHGDADTDNPVGQSLGLYRALKHVGVDTQLVVYPGEPHLPRSARHQRDILERMVRWYDEHLR
jgi:dipeptidyl aminopeptidase/acylaminoacyl peptidase